MAKALKVFVVLLLLLSGGALYLGIELFNQREVMKSRTQKGEDALDVIAKNLSVTGFQKTALIVATADQLPNVDKAQALVKGESKNRWDALKNAEKDYADTLARLDQTNAVLTATLQTLQERVEEVAKLKGDIDQLNQKVAQLDGQINELKTAKADLEQQVKDRDDKVARHEETIKDLKEEVKADEEDIKRLEAELAGCTNPETGEPYIRPGTAGRVVKVNDDWNFVILNLGTNQGAVPNGRMYVHRDDKLIGRVKFAVVSKNMSVAEIERDWQQGTIQEGDFVVR